MPVSGSLTFNVPEGRVLVPRSIFFYPTKTFTTVSATGNTILPVTMSLFAAGSAVPEMTNIDLTFSEPENEYPIHFIIPIEGTLRIQLIASTPSNALFDVAIVLYGNSLLSTARPINLEIATHKPRPIDPASGDYLFPDEGQTS